MFLKGQRVWDIFNKEYGTVLEATKSNGYLVYFDDHEFPSMFREQSAQDQLVKVE